MRVSVALFGFLAVLAAAGCKPEKSPTTQTNSAASTNPDGLEKVSIATRNGQLQDFLVEVARTPEQQKQGLQGRTSLDENMGMIFPMDPPRTTSMWMENMQIPLDVIFIKTDGSIESIANSMEPKSREPRSSNEPVAAIMEIKGGEAMRRGIQVGDKVTWPGLPR